MVKKKQFDEIDYFSRLKYYYKKKRNCLTNLTEFLNKISLLTQFCFKDESVSRLRNEKKIVFAKATKQNQHLQTNEPFNVSIRMCH